MEVILTQDVRNVGQAGKVIKVKDGYARNYLLPKNLAFIATSGNLKRIALLEKKRKEEFESKKQEALALAEKLEKVSCTVAVEVNDQEKLYGSVAETDVLKALEVEGFEIDKKQILLEQAIEELGIFEVGIVLHPEVTAKVRLWVTKK